MELVYLFSFYCKFISYESDYIKLYIIYAYMVVFIDCFSTFSFSFAFAMIIF